VGGKNPHPRWEVQGLGWGGRGGEVEKGETTPIIDAPYDKFCCRNDFPRLTITQTLSEGEKWREGGGIKRGALQPIKMFMNGRTSILLLKTLTGRLLHFRK